MAKKKGKRHSRFDLKSLRRHPTILDSAGAIKHSGGRLKDHFAEKHSGPSEIEGVDAVIYQRPQEKATIAGYSEALEEQIDMLRFVNSHAFFDYCMDQQASINVDRYADDFKTRADVAKLVKALTPFIKDIQTTVGAILYMGDTYYVDRAITDLIYGVSMTIPDWTLTEGILPTQQAYIAFNRPIPLPQSKRKNVDPSDLSGICWGTTTVSTKTVRSYIVFDDGRFDTDEITVVALAPIYESYARGGKGVPLHVIPWPVGMSFEEVTRGRVARTIERVGDPEKAAFNDVAEERLLQGMRFLAAFLQFVDQKLLVTTPTRANRAVRHRMEKEKRMPPVEPLIKVVALRKRKYVHGAVGGESEAQEWSCQWMVAGHWRQQWYPLLGIHQPKWIQPYIKGPEDKPLKTPRARVMAVVR